MSINKEKDMTTKKQDHSAAPRTCGSCVRYNHERGWCKEFDVLNTPKDPCCWFYRTDDEAAAIKARRKETRQLKEDCRAYLLQQRVDMEIDNKKMRSILQEILYTLEASRLTSCDIGEPPLYVLPEELVTRMRDIVNNDKEKKER